MFYKIPRYPYIYANLPNYKKKILLIIIFSIVGIILLTFGLVFKQKFCIHTES